MSSELKNAELKLVGNAQAKSYVVHWEMTIPANQENTVLVSIKSDIDIDCSVLHREVKEPLGADGVRTAKAQSNSGFIIYVDFSFKAPVQR